MPPIGVNLRTFRRWLLDAQGFETGFAQGIVRDIEDWRIPDGGSFDILDFLLDQPGKLYKRGGVDYQSGDVSPPDATNASFKAAMTPEFPNAPRVCGIATDGTGDNYLYDMTTGTPGSPQELGNFCPTENPPLFVSGAGTAMMILTYGDGTPAPPKKLTWNGSSVQVANLGGSPPNAKVSTVALPFLVLANDGDQHMNRIWFSARGDPETWVTTGVNASFIDMPEPVVGMQMHQGTLIVWSRHAMYRMLGTYPPGDSDADMSPQPVAQVGCIDARSIAKGSGGVYFANEDGVYVTDGASITSLTLGKGQSISSLWRLIMEQYKVKAGNSVAIGLFQDMYLFVTIYTDDGSANVLLDYLPTNGWVRLSNPCAAVMYAESLATLGEQADLIGASPWSASSGTIAHMVKFLSIFGPAPGNRFEADGTPVQPLWESRSIPSGSTTLKRFGNGRLVYRMLGSLSAPQLHISMQLGLLGEGLFHESHEGSPVGTTTGVERARFRMFKDGMALRFRVEQVGASDITEILGVEYEIGSFFTAEQEGQGEGV